MEDLLDSSFSCDDLGFDPLVSSAHIEQEVFTSATVELLPSLAEPDFVFDPPSTPTRPAEAPSTPLVDLAPCTPFALKPLLLASTLSNRPSFSTSAVRNPSPLKQVFSGAHDSPAFGSDQPAVNASGRLEGWEEQGTPVKRVPKKWAAVSQTKEGSATSGSRSPVKELAQADEQDPDSSIFVLPVEEYSLLLNEQASFLNTSREVDITLSSFPLSEIQEEASEDSIGDMRNLLSGRHQSTIGGPSPFLLPTRQHALRPAREAEDERSLLACSTASYREYRESPARPRMISVAESWGDEEDAMTPVKGGRKSDGSRSGTESDGSGDVGMLFRGWKGEEMATGEILGQTPPTGVIRTEATLTFELGLVSPILPTKSLSSSATSLASSSSSTSTIAPSSTSTAAAIPLPSSPPRTALASAVVLSPNAFFTEMQKNQVRSLDHVAVGSPRKDISASGSEEAPNLISMEELKAPSPLPIVEVAELLDVPALVVEDPVVAKVFEPVVVAKSRAESGTERLRKKLEELKNKKNSAVTPVIPISSRPTPSTPLARQRISSGLTTASAAKRPAVPIFDEDDSVVFGAAASAANDFDDSAPTPAAPRRTIARSNSMKKVTLSFREVKVPVSARKEVGVLESARKETTRERLDRAKEERARRETARSPVKKGMTTSASLDSFSTRSLVEAGAGATKLSSSTSRLPSGGLAPPRPRTTLSTASSSRLPPPTTKPIPSIADALAHKPASSLASRYRFNPAVPRPAPGTSTSLPAPLPKPTSRIASARPPTIATRTLSPSKSSTLLSPSKLVRASTEPAGLKRPTIGTGMQVPRSRVPLGGIQAPVGERGGGVGKPGTTRTGILAPRK